MCSHTHTYPVSVWIATQMRAGGLGLITQLKWVRRHTHNCTYTHTHVGTDGHTCMCGCTRTHNGWQYWPGLSTVCGWVAHCPGADVARGLDDEGGRAHLGEGRPLLPGIAETSDAALVRAAGLGQIPRPTATKFGPEAPSKHKFHKRTQLGT